MNYQERPSLTGKNFNLKIPYIVRFVADKEPDYTCAASISEAVAR